MKSMILSFMIIACLTANVFAQDAAAAKQPVKKDAAAPVLNDWEFFELVFIPGVPSSSRYSKIYGIKIGAPISGGSGIVDGLEASLFASMTANVNGFQTAGFYVESQKVNGLQFSIVNSADDVGGVQLGIVNIAQKKGFQIGLVNYIKDGAVPFLPIVNFNF
ncbi:MAG: hypothetical protein WC637_02990 [Victivallales bacterium]|jgi:hypothetical protein